MLSMGENNIYAAWSPDGTRLAYVGHDLGGQPDIIVANADASNPVGLNILMTAVSSSGPVAAIGPVRCSPDGQTLTFAITPGEALKLTAILASSEIFTIHVDGTGLVQLTQNEIKESNPCWSADGAQIFYTADIGGGTEIFRVNPDGTGAEPLFELGGKNIEPAVQP